MQYAKKPIKVNIKKVSYIEERAGYWRKANAIHNWFVKNVQEGEDNCRDYDVSQEQMEDLLATVNKVLKASKLIKGKIQNGQRSTEKGWEPIMEDGKYIEDSTVAQELLPTGEGFFFGSKDYDQWYVADLKETKKILTEAIKDLKENKSYDISFTYSSSW